MKNIRRNEKAKTDYRKLSKWCPRSGWYIKVVHIGKQHSRGETEWSIFFLYIWRQLSVNECHTERIHWPIVSNKVIDCETD